MGAGSAPRSLLIGCVFDGSFPADVTTQNCQQNVGGVSLIPLPHMNTTFCPRANNIPLPTATRSMSPTSTRAATVTGTPVPTPVLTRTPRPDGCQQVWGLSGRWTQEADCAEISGCVFANLVLNSNSGGAVYAVQKQQTWILDCAFSSCFASIGGGACAVGSTALTIVECCGVNCYAANWGQFLMGAPNVLMGTSIRLCSFVGCAPQSQSSPGVDCLSLPNSLGDVLQYANFTSNCVVTTGAVLTVESRPADDLISYLTVSKCSAEAAISNFRAGSSRVTIEYANFFDNTVKNTASSSSALFYVATSASADLRMSLSNCYFRGNTANRIYVASQSARFEFNRCAFSDAEPSSAPAGADNVWGTVTGSLPLPQLNTELCPYDSAVPFPTASQRPTATATPAPSKSRSPGLRGISLRRMRYYDRA
jgi:hypothetical protein